jgi:DNA-binding GntR family transcriptional regulator
MTAAGSTTGGAADADRPIPVVDAIRDAIADGEFAANQRLIEADLSERFGASRAACGPHSCN